MENAGKALEIAAGVFLGVMLMALVVYFFKTVGEWPQQEADTMTVEQLAKFNAEYEVYDKKGMYGVDVISCLNKAIDNNDKYLVDENLPKFGFLTEGRHPKDYCVNVLVSVKDNKLNEEMHVYHIENKNGKDREIESFMADETKTNVNLKTAFKLNFTDNKATKFNDTDKLIGVLNSSINIMGTKNGEYYSLLKEVGNDVDYDDTPSTKGNVSLHDLIKFSGDNLNVSVKNSGKNLNEWSSATWYTALYDLKKKRFKCDKIEYDEKSKRINAIYFSELKI